MFQFPLCGENVGKSYVSGNETQMSLALWSQVCDVFKEAPYEMCPSLPAADVCSRTEDGRQSCFSCALFRSMASPDCTLVFMLLCASLSAVSVRACAGVSTNRSVR